MLEGSSRPRLFVCNDYDSHYFDESFADRKKRVVSILSKINT